MPLNYHIDVPDVVDRVGALMSCLRPPSSFAQWRWFRSVIQSTSLVTSRLMTSRLTA